MGHTLDLVTIGRASVDLYGQQIGSRLEDIAGFAKSVGGCPANIAIGTARLGLKPALITRVGAEPMGTFIREQLVREGVATSGVKTDPDRLTALVLLAVEDEGVSPMIFYRADCADMALDENDIDADLIASARAVVVTGTHFSRPNAANAQRKAIGIAKAAGGKVVFDIDYRPNLWGLAGHAAGFERYVKSEAVTAEMRKVLADCDLIVGTEEEIMVAAGADSVHEALRAIRIVSAAPIVLKRGAMGCIVYAGAIGPDLEDGIVGRGFPIEVYNVLGAGDAFMAGFLSGWLEGEPLAACATRANACGAFAVSRLLCSPEYPSRAELDHFLKHGSRYRALRKDPVLAHIHRATTRRDPTRTLMALAIDHRAQLEAIADRYGAAREKIQDFKVLAVEAAARVAARAADGGASFGTLLDSTYGQKALYLAGKHGLWVARPVEKPGSRPIEFDGIADIGGHLVEWPVGHVVKCLCFYRTDDPPELRVRQDRELLRVEDATKTVGRELLVEIIAGKHGPVDEATVADVLEHLYRIGLKPDWWKLEPQAEGAAWGRIAEVIDRNDPYCRGIVMLGLEAAEHVLIEAFRAAAATRLVKGFAIGRTIFAPAAEGWFAGTMDDDAAVSDMARRFESLTNAWRAAVAGATAE